MKITNHAVERWSSEDANAIFNLPFFDLLSRANSVLRESFEPNSITVCTLFSIKTGSCPEDCKYCSQSAHYNTGIKKEPLVDLDALMLAAKAAKESGTTRFCMGAAWRSPKGSNLTKAIEMIKAVKGLGLETCVTFGLLNEEQALELKAAGLDYYNHNIDTSEQFYDKVITTRTFQDRLNTLKCVRDSGINVCSGGIVGMGESAEDRIQMLLTLSNLPKQPESVPLNMLVQIPGTPLADAKPIDNFDFVRLIALARIMMPNSYVRLSAGRESMSDELQALCFFAGANSIFYGDKLLTTGNNEPMKDDLLLAKFGLKKIYPSQDL